MATSNEEQTLQDETKTELLKAIKVFAEHAQRNPHQVGGAGLAAVAEAYATMCGSDKPRGKGASF